MKVYHWNDKPTGHLGARSPAREDKVDRQVGEQLPVAKLGVGVATEKALDSCLPVDEEERGSRAELLLLAGEVLHLIQGQTSQGLAGESPRHQDGDGARYQHDHQWL